MNRIENTSIGSEPARPWYRESWVWFVIALPLSAVVAGIGTVVIATGGSDSLVVDDFNKVGLVARRETARERAAARLGVAAVVSLDRRSGEVTVRLDGADEPASLSLGLFHPTRREFDRTAMLSRDAAGLYRGSVGADVSGRWYVQLADSEGDWRVTGRITADESLVSIAAGQ